MENPFESGHIKNYILLYASVVVIMILFFFASTLFHDVTKVDKKVFNTTQPKELNSTLAKEQENAHKTKFKLMPKSY
jgi:hypothetical protein